MSIYTHYTYFFSYIDKYKYKYIIIIIAFFPALITIFHCDFPRPTDKCQLTQKFSTKIPSLS